jgi:ATP-dependent Lon protease
VLPVGGIKEKVLAARRVGIREVIVPKQNGKNINEDLTPELRQNLKVHLVSTIDEVLALALGETTRQKLEGKSQKAEGKSNAEDGKDVKIEPRRPRPTAPPA